MGKNGLCNSARGCVGEINKAILNSIKEDMLSFGIRFVTARFDITIDLANYIASMTEEQIEEASKSLPPLVKISLAG